MTAVLIDAASHAVPLVPVSPTSLPGWLDAQDAAVRRWAEGTGFRGTPGTWCAVPGTDGGLSRVLVGMADPPDLYALAHLPLALPEGDYALAEGGVRPDPAAAALGFALGAYQFTRYRAGRRAPARLLLPDGVDRMALRALAGATTLVRDLVNTPTEHMGPAELAATVSGIATAHGGKFQEWVGEELLAANFPAIHAVGRASHRPPRLLQMTWGDPRHPHVAIVGKGVCFDTGGLDIKPADGMRHMKKDMGGGAHAIALAELVMASHLPVRLNLLVPAVENAIAGNAYRPGEVVRTRAGFHVEIDNTDAEGRVVLCDALTFAAQQRAALILDFATLTGAARIALGPDLPALFANHDALAAEILARGRAEQDPLWQLPLWQGYRPMLDSPVADFANAGPSRHAGAITAALYLERFVPPEIPWAHVDVYAWNDLDRPGRPKGGEAQGLRAFFRFLQRRFGA
ncbi:MAG: leucyl aminopeptidase family protein [Pseudomonadota bacterium]